VVKLVALYKKPADVLAFEDHFSGIHLSLMEKLPGVVKTELTRFFAGPKGEPPFYMLFEVYFANRESLNAALQSPENRAADRDLMSFAQDCVTIMFADAYESK
jgi:uncharacterized protein (TIGR02118 family)